MKKKSLLIISLVAIALLGGILYRTYSPSTTITYLTETVQKGNLQKSVIATGTVRAYQRVEVGAQVSGKIEKIHVKLGQNIKQGDLIAEIDSKTQINNLNTAQAKLASYQAQKKAKQVALEIAKSSYDRASKLYQQKSLSLDELYNSKNTFAASEAALEEVQAAIQQAEIEVNNAKTNLAYTKILSPINGTIISIPVSEGQTVNANQTTPTLVQVADLSKILIKPEISESDITKIHAGMKVSFNNLAEPEIQYQGEIHSVDPAMTTISDNEYKESVADTNAVYYYANIIVDNPQNKLRLGMTIQNTINIANEQNVLLIPTMTLQKKGNKTMVQVLKDNNQVEQREVQIGLNDDVNTQIISGLTEGEKVVSSQVAEGEKVGNTRTPRIF